MDDKMTDKILTKINNIEKLYEKHEKLNDILNNMSKDPNFIKLNEKNFIELERKLNGSLCDETYKK